MHATFPSRRRLRSNLAGGAAAPISALRRERGRPLQIGIVERVSGAPARSPGWVAGTLMLVLLSPALSAEDPPPAADTAAPDSELARLRQRLDALEHEVEDLRRQPSTAAAAASGSSLEDRIWNLEADQLTDSNVALGGSGVVAVTAGRSSGRSVDAEFNPIVLYSYRQEVLFVGELNADLDGISLGQAYVAYTALPHVVVEAGLFPLPFAAYSERFSPPWINRMATSAPPPYADEYGLFAGDQSDVGLQVRGDIDLGGNARANYHLFVVEGPGYGDPDNPTDPDDRLAFGGVTTADHVPPTVGVRLGLLPNPSAELGLSAMTGRIHNNETFDPAIDTTARRSFTAAAVDAQYRWLGTLLLGEWLYVSSQGAAGDRRREQGFYVQASRFFHLGESASTGIEPVVRAGRVERDVPEAGYRSVDEVGGGITCPITGQVRASVMGELHSVHPLDQIVVTVVYAF